MSQSRRADKASAPPLEIRDATEADLSDIVAMLADDMLGAARDSGAVDPAYFEALRAIQAEPNGRQLVAVEDGAIVGCFQLNFLPGLGRHGSWRAQIESVRVATQRRNGGIGAAMMRWAIEQARQRLCFGPAHDRQAARGCAPVLPTARVRGEPRGDEAHAVTARVRRIDPDAPEEAATPCGPASTCCRRSSGPRPCLRRSSARRCSRSLEQR
jgi:GNAT superfamily N-acetyltransferase